MFDKNKDYLDSNYLIKTLGYPNEIEYRIYEHKGFLSYQFKEIKRYLLEEQRMRNYF